MSVNKILDHDVKVIKKNLEDMLIATKKQYEETYQAVINADYSLAKKVIKNDKKINDMQNSFTNMALWKITKQQMVASDLRLAVGSIIISREIEKIADYTKSICWYLIDMHPDVKNLEYIKNNFHFVIEMIDIIVSLINHYDTDLPVKIRSFENEVNASFKKARMEIIKDIRNSSTDEEALSNYVSLRQFKKLERAAEHIISIEEVLDFVRTGKFDDADKYKKILDSVSNESETGTVKKTAKKTTTKKTTKQK